MRLRLTFDHVVVFDVSVFEPAETEDQPEAEPSAVVDMSTGHDIGFSSPAGWVEPKAE